MKHQVLEIHIIITLGASKHCHQLIPEITRNMELYGCRSRITNVLESRDNQGLQPNNEWTNTMYESQWCNDVAEFEHMRHNHPERN